MVYRAVRNGQALAESDTTVKAEGNHCLPPQSLNRDLPRASGTRTRCPWKGTAHYYTIVVDGKENPDAAWYYPGPSPAAARITGHVALWHGVRAERVAAPGESPAPRTRWWRRLSGSRG